MGVRGLRLHTKGEGLDLCSVATSLCFVLNTCIPSIAFPKGLPRRQMPSLTHRTPECPPLDSFLHHCVSPSTHPFWGLP